MPSRHKTKHGIRWRARIDDGPRRVSLGLYDTREEATIVEEQARRLRDDNPRTVGQWLAEFLVMREKEKLHRNAWRYKSVGRRILEDDIAHRPLRALTEADVRAFVRRLVRTPAKPGRGHKTDPNRTLSRSAIAQTLTLLRMALERAVEEGAARTNVARAVRVPRMARTSEGWDWLRADDVEALLAAKLRDEQRAAFTVAIFTGLRAGELWGLRWNDVELRGARPEVVVRHSYRQATKSGKVRRVPLLPRALEALEAWQKLKPGVGHALVFPADGGGCHSSGFDAGLPAALRRAGVRRVRFHDLRHTCASHLVQGTWTRAPLRLEDVRVWLGHGSVTTTERYAHLCPGGLHDLAAVPLDDGEEQTR